jgi:hypothetical protein
MNNAQELNMSALHVPDYLGHRRENLQQEKAHYSLHARRLPSRLRQHVTTTSEANDEHQWEIQILM